MAVNSVILLNDCTRFNHFGCTLVTETYKEQFERVGIEVLAYVPSSRQRHPDYKRYFDQADLVVVNGEGSLHDNVHLPMIQIAAEYPSILINCVYQNMPHMPELQKFLYRSARESLSAKEMGVQCDVIPDIILTNKLLNKLKNKKRVGEGVGVTDCARPTEPGFTAHLPATTYLDYLLGFEGVVCGRFHSALACAVLGIPFSLYPSNTHKNMGLALDMGISHLHGDTRKEAISMVPDSFPEQIHKYVEDGQKKVNELFEKMDTFV